MEDWHSCGAFKKVCDESLSGDSFAGSLVSTIGSSVIVMIILRSKTRFSSFYHRILFGLSIIDILCFVIALTLLLNQAPEQGTNDGRTMVLGFGFGDSSAQFVFTFREAAIHVHRISLYFHFVTVIVFMVRKSNIKRRIGYSVLAIIPVLVIGFAAEINGYGEVCCGDREKSHCEIMLSTEVLFLVTMLVFFPYLCMKVRSQDINVIANDLLVYPTSREFYITRI